MENYNIKRGEVYWCEFPYGTGSEQIGRRPVIVVSNDKCNEFSPTITVIPITSAKKKKMPTHAIVRATKETGVALAEQLFTVSKDRITDYINCCTSDEMEWIDKCLKIQLGVYDYSAGRTDEKVDDEGGVVRVISRGYKCFRTQCGCCGSVYEYNFGYTVDGGSKTKCPECGCYNSHGTEFGITSV